MKNYGITNLIKYQESNGKVIQPEIIKGKIIPIKIQSIHK